MANKKFFSTKTYRQIGPVAYRQWRAQSHCNLIHGYAMSFHFEFEADTLDARNWVTDFGGLKPLKEKLDAGACLVQVYTGFIYEGPGIAKKICNALLK